jgi:hypothetical protein
VAPTLPQGITSNDHLDLLPFLTVPRTIESLCDLVDRSPVTVRTWIEGLKEQGYNIGQRGESFIVEKEAIIKDVPVVHKTKNLKFKLAFTSDRHYCSKTQQRTYAKQFTSICDSEGVEVIYDAGDIFAGTTVYAGQSAEIFMHTEDDQLDYVTEEFPRRSFGRTVVIGGNHDYSFLKHGGTDPVKILSMRRPDIEYIGPYAAHIELEIGGHKTGRYIDLLHPDGGTIYASSYRLQKMIEALEGGNKPLVLVAGHFHRRCYIFERNVHGLLAACFEAQTSFLKRKAVQPVVGGTIVDLEFNDDGSLQKFTPHFYSYLIPIEKDY